MKTLFTVIILNDRQETFANVGPFERQSDATKWLNKTISKINDQGCSATVELVIPPQRIMHAFDVAV